MPENIEASGLANRLSLMPLLMDGSCFRVLSMTSTVSEEETGALKAPPLSSPPVPSQLEGEPPPQPSQTRIDVSGAEVGAMSPPAQACESGGVDEESPLYDACPIPQPALQPSPAPPLAPAPAVAATAQSELARLLERSRRFSLDLCPRAVMSAGGLVELLISSGVGRYCEFKLLDAVFTLSLQGTVDIPPPGSIAAGLAGGLPARGRGGRGGRGAGGRGVGNSGPVGSSAGRGSSGGRLWRVPCSKRDVFESAELSMLEKVGAGRLPPSLRACARVSSSPRSAPSHRCLVARPTDRATRRNASPTWLTRWLRPPADRPLWRAAPAEQGSSPGYGLERGRGGGRGGGGRRTGGGVCGRSRRGQLSPWAGGRV